MNPTMIEMLRKFFATQPVLRVWLFGSYSRGEQTPDSDVDLLVDFDHEHAKIGLLEYVRMSNSISQMIGKKVDLVENGSLLPAAEKTAQADKQLIYERAS